MVVDLPPMYEEPVMQCIRYASNEFQVPQLALMSVLRVEGGKPGMKKRNLNVPDPYLWDYGRSQFNSSNIEVLKRFGVQNAEHHIQHNDCYNIRVGAWWLKKEMMSCGGLWCGIGSYHTGANIRTKKKLAENRHYQSMVYAASLYIGSHYRWQ